MVDIFRFAKPGSTLSNLIDFGTKAAQGYAAVESVRGLRDQRKALKRQEGVQQEAQREAEAIKSHQDREMRWNLARGRRSYGVSASRSGYPTGY